MVIKIIQLIFCPALGPNNTSSRLCRGLTGIDSIFISNRVLSDAFKRFSKTIFSALFFIHYKEGDRVC